MEANYPEHPEQFRGTGTVFAAWLSGEDGYDAYWDSLPDEQPSFPIEPGPRTRSLSEIVEWGRERTPRVLVRPEQDPAEYYWAGAEEPLGKDAALKRLCL
jgi:hypothetical protein